MIAVLWVALVAAVVIVLLDLEHRGYVELEWNPLSDASRGARAERAGMLAEALWYFDRAGRPDDVVACLERSLPESALRAELVAAVDELIALRRGLTALRSLVTVNPGPVAIHAVGFAEGMAGVLWQTAERIAAVSAFWDLDKGLPTAGQATVERLRETRVAIRRVRDELGGLIFSGQDPGGLEMALTRSTDLAETIHALTGPVQ